ncbi:hypothetical protein J437_LFUL001298 [Ladona fulva]|uniref:B9 domain-containing protein 2 n=1 Tax=Ladona fulva TaxID=123851 RepID=A0A8K0JTL9_LADFU|nr:hypothetical protein J437_LFUL001298 [Ladona fulva]
MAEVHIIGQIIGGRSFPSKSIFCRWGIWAGSGWKLIEGLKEGQTQVDSPVLDDISFWCHPIDVHFAVKSLQGWPKLHLQVYHLDEFGRIEIFGYGFIHIPSSPGVHEISCLTWRPAAASLLQKLRRFFLGGGPYLRNPDLVLSSAERYRLRTESMGEVYVELGVILRNFQTFGVEV